MTNDVAVQKSIPDVIEEYNRKYLAIDENVDAYAKSVTNIKMDSCVAGEFGTNVFGSYGDPKVYRHLIEKNLLNTAWKHVYKGMNVDKIASAKDRKKFEQFFENPLPFNIENIRETFGDYFLNQRFHVLKGLAECFCDLDPAYRSHSNVKIGVNGLPKRIILTNVSDYSDGWGYDRLKDVLRALYTYLEIPQLEYSELSDWMKSAKREPTELNGLTLKRFKNGNAHLIFGKEMLVHINKALAEFYGEVLPDAPTKTDKHKPSTEVSKDLQFYPTPRKSVMEVMRDVWFEDGTKILEPSCGDGAFLDRFKEISEKVDIDYFGIEYDKNRVEVCRQKGHNVLNANFLETVPEPIYDYVIMNPPFYGKHYLKHIEHAIKFLKKGGQLISVLPATAWYDHKMLPNYEKSAKLSSWNSPWKDLPVGSFSESGTNVPTGYWKYYN